MKHWIRPVGLSLLAAVAACTAVGYRSSCFEVLYGDIEVDWSSGSISFSGLCIRRLNSACPELRNCKVQAGVDRNGNGVLDPGETLLDVNDPSPGDQFCVAAAHASISSADRGKQLILHYEASRSDQPDKPFVSKNDSKTLE